MFRNTQKENYAKEKVCACMCRCICVNWVEWSTGLKFAFKDWMFRNKRIRIITRIFYQSNYFCFFIKCVTSSFPIILFNCALSLQHRFHSGHGVVIPLTPQITTSKQPQTQTNPKTPLKFKLLAHLVNKITQNQISSHPINKIWQSTNIWLKNQSVQNKKEDYSKKQQNTGPTSAKIGFIWSTDLHLEHTVLPINKILEHRN